MDRATGKSHMEKQQQCPFGGSCDVGPIDVQTNGTTVQATYCSSLAVFAKAHHMNATVQQERVGSILQMINLESLTRLWLLANLLSSHG